MDATSGSGSNSPVWPIVDDNGAVDMDAMTDNLENRISNLEKSDETPSSDDTTDENIIKFEVAAKSKGSTSKPEWVTTLFKIPNLDPPAGIFVNHRKSLFECDVVSLDSRLELIKSATDNSLTLASTEETDNVKILQCNGLLLCSGSSSPAFYYVYNPCTNMFKRIPQPENSNDDSYFLVTVVLRMTFDPRKSLDYKVVQVGACLNSDLEIQVYSSEIGNWGLCKDRIGSDDPMLVLIDIPGVSHLEGRLFESLGCLLLVCRDDTVSREFTMYEMMKGSFVWTVQYLVNTDEFMTPLPLRWSIRSTVWSIGLEERKEDSCLVINLSEKVVKYNLISKTISQIFDIGSNQMDDDDILSSFHLI
ncbi:hypothetical protein Tco_0680679 [Tanacetum coccineum]|uniref:F-box protein At3g26010-like beta-propeller domain-containing protein n=1 Tax=Tanacetum coccineum TaxID=301880 RepID=A0ABQ4XMM2_9ASTR